MPPSAESPPRTTHCTPRAPEKLATPLAVAAPARPSPSSHRSSQFRRPCFRRSAPPAIKLCQSCRHLLHISRGCCARFRLPYEQHSHANQQHTEPPLRRNVLMQKYHRQQRQYRVPKRSRGHHVAIIRPAHHRHVAGHKSNQKKDPNPDRRIRHRQPKRVPQRTRGDLHDANLRHSTFQHQVPNVGAHYHRKDHDQRLDPKPSLACHEVFILSFV